MSDDPEAPAPKLEFVGKFDGVVDCGELRAPYKVEVDPKVFGEWEYVAVVKVPSYELIASTPKPLLVKHEGERFRLDLQIDPDLPTAFDDLVILEGEDGYQHTVGVAKQGKMHSHAPGMTTLIFEGVSVGVKYTCTIDPGKEGRPYRLFKDFEIKQEHLLPKEDAPKQDAGGNRT